MLELSQRAQDKAVWPYSSSLYPQQRTFMTNQAIQLYRQNQISISYRTGELNGETPLRNYSVTGTWFLSWHCIHVCYPPFSGSSPLSAASFLATCRIFSCLVFSSLSSAAASARSLFFSSSSCFGSRFAGQTQSPLSRLRSFKLWLLTAANRHTECAGDSAAMLLGHRQHNKSNRMRACCSPLIWVIMEEGMPQYDLHCTWREVSYVLQRDYRDYTAARKIMVSQIPVFWNRAQVC